MQGALQFFISRRKAGLFTKPSTFVMIMSGKERKTARVKKP
jgi:hypothetical protein